ncbi:MAG: YfdX family protein [Ferrovum sp.]|nr:YfdX family protein [Ferrovum sp.]
MFRNQSVPKFSLMALLVMGALHGPARAADNAAPVHDGKEKSAAASQEQGHVSEESVKALLKQREALVKEAVVANEEMLQAIASLEKGDKEAAYKLLADASGKLDVALARDPHLKQMPISVRVSTTDLASKPSEIKHVLSQAKSQLSDGQVQAAKKLLRPLTSEIRVTTESLPMETYPGQIKLASKEIQEGKSSEAAQRLADTLGSIATEEKVIPLPPLKAEMDVEEAEVLIQQDKTKNRDQVLGLLNQAKQQLEVGKLLGYGNYKDIGNEMEAVKSKITGGSWDTKMFDRLKNLLHEAKSKI